MLWRLEVGLKDHVRDVVGEKTARQIRDALAIDVDEVRIIHIYTIAGLPATMADAVIDAGCLHDPVLHHASTAPLARHYDWLVEVGFRPGVTDNEGRTAQEALALVLGLDAERRRKLAVYTSTQHLISGKLTREQAQAIGSNLLANELIQRTIVRDHSQGADLPAFAAKVTGQSIDHVERIDLDVMTDEEMLAFSRENTLALSLSEMHTIRDYYADPGVRAAREAAGIGPTPTDAEIECLAQTWSEHCKHKIFNARIAYEDRDKGAASTVDSLFKTYIQGSTAAIRAMKGENDYCLSVFKDNAGVFKFSDDLSICVKMETHNSPSALDPYGGALTGIVGVNRDPMGTGLGARLLCNTDVFCFASPFYVDELPPRLLHPKRVMEGVRLGVEHGGNKSGIPTVNGSVVFDERYLGKPLVYCGTVGCMPAAIHGKPSHEKAARPGDAIVMCGGRIGKDGIHGATFSSEELHEGSPATAVQIGDPITQRRMYDFLMRARDNGWYSAITDNGAGGLSSSVGEMAEEPGGAVLDLARAPLKYDGLRPWEILLSEAQERMTLAVPPERLDDFLALAREMDVEATVLGEFTDSGEFDVRYGDTPVALIDMAFLHEGLPQMELSAVWEKPRIEPTSPPSPPSRAGLLARMLGRLNICSKEYMIRQYDHEVQGGSAVKPLGGVLRDGPNDAGVIRPDLGSERGLVVSHGICPKFSDYDAYWMMACAIDEAVRNAVAVGADPDYLVGVDNFCWCDPVQSEKTPDGEYKLAQLVRANQALAHFCQALGVPCVSGKDSMKNDYYGGGRKISIPPTVLYSVVGVVPDVNRCCTSDFKAPGHVLYVLGRTEDELGGSEAASELGFVGAHAPQVDALANRARYRALHRAMMDGLVTACHDCSDGGLGVAVAEMAIGGRLGARIDLACLPGPDDLDELAALYGESAGRLVVTVAPQDTDTFEARFAGQACERIGEVTTNGTLVVSDGADELFTAEVQELAKAFKATLDW